MKTATKRMTQAELTDVFIAAREAAVNELEHGDTDDGGACNLDSAVIELAGYPQRLVQAAADVAGVGAYKLSGRWWAGCYGISTPSAGQGFRRTRIARAAHKAMEAASGRECSMYMQMD